MPGRCKFVSIWHIKYIMCVFLTLRLNKSQIKKKYSLGGVDEEDFGPVFFQSAFNFSPWPVISCERPGQLSMMNWGLIPHWVNDEKMALNIRKSTVNARIETVSEKPSFREPLRSSRCLILADGFYEFREVNKNKYPYFIQLRGGVPFTMAGVFDHWLNARTGKIISGFSILTTEANPLMEKIHNRKKRMPVILQADKQEAWIEFKLDPIDLSLGFPEDKMEAWPVSKLITARDKMKNVSEAIIPYNYPELQLFDSLGF